MKVSSFRNVAKCATLPVLLAAAIPVLAEPVAEPLPVVTEWDFTAEEGWPEISDLFTGATNVSGRVWNLAGCHVYPTSTGGGDTGNIQLQGAGSSYAVAPVFRGVVSQVSTIFRPTTSGNREATLFASLDGGATFSVVTNYAFPQKQNYENTFVFDPPLDGGDLGVIFCASNSSATGTVQLRRLTICGASIAPDEPGLYDCSPFGVAAAEQPTGALSGVVLFLNPGLGYAADAATNGWTTGAGLVDGVVDDFGNLDQMNFFAQQAWKAGATIVPMRPLGYQTNEVVIDNVDVSRVTFGGAWADAVTNRHYGCADDVGYRWTYACSTGTTAWASYRPDIPAAGEYPVYVWVPADADRVQQLYRVRHAGGVTEVRVDHRKVGDGWVWLGSFWFDKGTGGYVNVSNYAPGLGEDGIVIADAIRFGNGMGDIARGDAGVSGLERELEASRYWIERQALDSQGLPSSIYDGDGDDRDDDAAAAARMAEQMCRTNDCPPWSHLVVSLDSGGAAPATLKSLRGRESLARDALAGVIGNLATNHSGSTVFETLPPDAPVAVAARGDGLCCATVSWKMPAVADRVSDPHTGFVIYASTDGYDFGYPVQIASTADEGSYTFTGLPGAAPCFFRVCAVNAGGESLPSPVTGTKLSDDGSRANILVVDAFRRADSGLTPTRRYDRVAGVSGPADVSLVRPRMINSFDYVKEHGNAIAASPNGCFDSMDATLVTARDLAGRPVAVWCLGRESAETETLSHGDQQLISTFLANGGALFVSGTEIGRDLGQMGSAADRYFLTNALSCAYVSDDVATNSVTGKSSSYFSRVFFEFNYTDAPPDTYAAGRAEIFRPLGDGFLAATYDGADASQGPIIALEDRTRRTVVMGIPFETIAAADQRNKLMKKVLNLFDENVSTPSWIGDTAYTTGVGGEVVIDLKTQVTGYPSPNVTLVGSSDSRTGEAVDESAYVVTEDGFIFNAGAKGISEGTYTFTFLASNGAGGDIYQEVIISVGNTPIWQPVPVWLVDLDEEATLNLYRYVSGDPVPYIALAHTDADEATYRFDAEEGYLAMGLESSPPTTNVFTFTAANAYGSASTTFTVIVRRLDSDEDGIPDWWAKKYFGNPTACNPNLDSDGDRFTNREEYEAGTDPLDRYSQPLPDYLENAAPAVVVNYVDWASIHGPDLLGLHEPAFLLDAAPDAVAACAGAPLRVASIVPTSTGVRLELASDVRDLFQPTGGNATNLCNGYAAVEIITNLVSSGKLAIPVPVAIDAATGHAVVELEYSDYLNYVPGLISSPPSLFFRPVLTPIYPDNDPAMWE